MQEVYINIDDSGKLSKKESCCVYGGIVFLSKHEKDKFITQYRSIVKSLKCKYCENTINSCNNKCPEIKSSLLKNSDRRRFINYINNYYVIACMVKNQLVYDSILSDKAAKGRYLDYVLRRTIKDVISNLIKLNKIDPNKPLRLILNIDEQTTKSNGYYNLKDGLNEELVHGIINFNYDKVYSPILFGGLTIQLQYQHSDQSYTIQAADLIAGTVRMAMIKHTNKSYDFRKATSFVNLKKMFP